MADSLDQLSAAEKRELLGRLLKSRSAGQSHLPSDEFPMSAGQQAIWYAFRRDPNQTAYNVFLPSRFRTPVDLAALRKSVELLAERHRALRTVFFETDDDHRPMQRVLTTLPPEFSIVDASGFDEQTIQRRVLAETQRPFDLSVGPLLRVTAFRVSHDDVVIVATTQHIIVDFWSLILMMDEIRAAYPTFAAGQIPQLAPAVSNYDAFVRAQIELTESESGRQIGQTWISRLADVRPVLQWTTDYPRPPKFSHRAAVAPIVFSDSVAGKVTALAKRLNVTANVVVLAMVQVLIARFSGQDSFSIGTPFSGRSQREYEQTVGFFVNLLPIPADLSGSPTLEGLVPAVGRQLIDALSNEALPLSQIVRLTAPGRDPSRHPLFQVSCTFEKSQLAVEQGRAGFLLGHSDSSIDFAGMRQQSFPIPHPTCHYDVEFVFELGADQIHGMVCYCRDLFAADTINSMVHQFSVLVDQMLQQPGRCVRDIPWDIKPTARLALETAGSASVMQLLADCPHQIVARAETFAKELIRAGVLPGQLVPVCYPRGQQAWIGILAAIRAGAVPVPIDSDQPAVSLATLLADGDVGLVVARPGEPWLDDSSVRNPNLPRLSIESSEPVAESDALQPDPDELAYVVYTSGSTGTPKGVMIPQRGIVNTLEWRRRAVPLHPDDRVLILLSHQFDAAMAVVLSTLHQHATPVWPTDSTLDLDCLIDQIIDDQITVLPAVPTLMRALVDHPRFGDCVSLRQIWCGGESMPSDLPGRIRSKQNCEIWNFYGPTEASVEAAAMQIDECDPRRRIPIGKAIDGAQILIVDQQLAAVPVGVVGQIAIAGRGLATGYLNRPSATATAFVDLQDSSSTSADSIRVYLTGDLGRQRGDGMIEFIGRMDHQVKVRGYRVELEEIESTIERHPDVIRAAVKVVAVGTDAEQLAAFVTVGSAFQTESLRRTLADWLPPFKRPGTITVVDALPLGSSGKIRRDQLPEPAATAADSRAMIKPSNALQSYLQKRFAESLGQDTISIDLNYFEAGGTSLQAAMLTAQLSSDLGVAVPTALLFDLGDVVSVADRLAQLYRPLISDRFGDDSIVSEDAGESGLDNSTLLTEFYPRQDATPLFMIHPPGGIVLCYREIAQQLDSALSLVAVRSRGLHGDEPLPGTIAEMASDYIAAIRTRAASGPYWIGGWSLGGVVAYEVARQLIADGDSVSGIILLDSALPQQSDTDATSAGQEYGIDLTLAQLSELSDDQQLPFLYEHATRLGVLVDDTPEEVVTKVIRDLQTLFSHHVSLCQAYRLAALDVPTLLIRPSDVPGTSDPRPDRGWGNWVGDVTVGTASGHHHSMVQQPGAKQIANQIQQFVISR
ncbi:amino acid adenylation domain-containing protein [Stieleria sp. TO1_6]|uniref:non-ribosomal peptide synthetase n=1 Tax=Stieleria tagensis TaxID=2956795 RepID=UPI00209BA1D3|nr:non-ribosomal peptide synthetase [Stieleria tagensis]MCO8122154.1 amino acid adenylation domain-containing protein [Stieleria tagensis]